MDLDQLTALELFYTSLCSVLAVYFVVALIERAIGKRHAQKRRR